MQSTFLWVGVAGMALGAAAFLAMSLSAKNHRDHYVITFFVPLIAAASYLAMALGSGITTVGSREVYYARYLDWVLTTPLLLLDLALLAMPFASRNRGTLIGGLIGADVFMIVTGLIATLSNNDTMRWTFYIVSCVALLAIYFLLFGQVRAEAASQSAESLTTFNSLSSILVVLWLFYPVAWLLGTEGLKLFGLDIEVAAFAIVDVIAKVGFGFILLSALRRIPDPAPAGNKVTG